MNADNVGISDNGLIRMGDRSGTALWTVGPLLVSKRTVVSPDVALRQPCEVR
jgi:hypothetical protein